MQNFEVNSHSANIKKVIHYKLCCDFISLTHRECLRVTFQNASENLSDINAETSTVPKHIHLFVSAKGEGCEGPQVGQPHGVLLLGRDH